MSLESSNSVQTLAIRKPAGMTHFSNPYKFHEKKLLNYCVKVVEKSGYVDREYEAPMEDVKYWVQFGKTRNTKWLRGLAKGLFKAVEWNSMGKDNSTKWTAVPALKKAEIDGDTFRWKMNDEFMDIIRKVEIYGQIMALAQLCVKDENSLTMYEFFCTELSTAGEDVLETVVELSIGQLRHVLGFEPTKYKEYRDFSRYVIKKFSDDISKNTNVGVEWEPLKDNGTVRAIRFTVSWKPNHTFIVKGSPEKVVPSIGDAIEAANTVSLLREHRIWESKAKQLVAMYGIDQIERNVAYAVDQHKAGQAKDLQRFMVSAIEMDYAPKDYAKPGPVTVAAEVEEIDWAARFEEARTKMLDSYFVKQDDTWLHLKRQEFIDCGGLDGDLISRSNFDKEGWESDWVNDRFRSWVAKQVLDDQYLSVEAYTSWCAETAKS
ncbi:MAG: replication initiation protein [Pseudomonadota bacterium]